MPDVFDELTVEPPKAGDIFDEIGLESSKPSFLSRAASTVGGVVVGAARQFAEYATKKPEPFPEKSKLDEFPLEQLVMEYAIKPLGRPVSTIQRGGAAALQQMGIIDQKEYERVLWETENRRPLLPDVEQQHTLPGKVMAGGVQIVLDFVNAFSDPDLLGMIGLGGVAPAAQKMVLGKFALDMLKSSPEQLQMGIESAQQGDLQGAIRHVGGGAVATALSAKLTGKVIEQPGGIKPMSESTAAALERDAFIPETAAAIREVSKPEPKPEGGVPNALQRQERQEEVAEPPPGAVDYGLGGEMPRESGAWPELFQPKPKGGAWPSQPVAEPLAPLKRPISKPAEAQRPTTSEAVGKFRLNTNPNRLDAEIEGESGILLVRAVTYENKDGSFSVDSMMAFVPPGILDAKVAERRTINLSEPITGKTPEEARTKAYLKFTEELNTGRFSEAKPAPVPTKQLEATKPPRLSPSEMNDAELVEWYASLNTVSKKAALESTLGPRIGPAIDRLLESPQPPAEPAKPTAPAAEIGRGNIREKQDRVIAIAKRRGMDESTPISSLQEQAPTIKELRENIWPDFEESIDSFLKEFEKESPPAAAGAPPAPTRPRVFFDDAVGKYTATEFHNRWGNMVGTGETPELAISALNEHIAAADRHGTWRSVNHPKPTAPASAPPPAKPGEAAAKAENVKPTEWEPSEAQYAELQNLKDHFPYREIFAAFNPETKEFRALAETSRRRPNDLARKGWIVHQMRGGKRQKPTQLSNVATPENAPGEVQTLGLGPTPTTTAPAAEAKMQAERSFNEYKAMGEKPISSLPEYKSFRDTMDANKFLKQNVSNDAQWEGDQGVGRYVTGTVDAGVKTTVNSGRAETTKIRKETISEAVFELSNGDLVAWDYNEKTDSVNLRKVQPDDPRFYVAKDKQISTKPPTEPEVPRPFLKTVTPAPAAEAKMQAEVSDVAKKEGQRPAKDVKKDLVAELEKAVADAPDEAPDRTKLREAFDKLPVSSESKIPPQERWQFIELAKDTARRKKVTIEIPGDGTFTVVNDKYAIGELLRRAKRLSISTEPPKGFKESQPSRPQSQAWMEEARTQPPTEPAKPEIVGMGGAVPGEFERSAGTATGIKNATVDAERAKRGMPPAMTNARRGFEEVWDQAMAKIDQDPSIQDRLVKELEAKPRALTDVEDAMILHRQIDLQNEFGKATRDLAQAYEDRRMADVEDQRARVDDISDRLKNIYDVGKLAGTETGRGLNARKMMAMEDFSLASMELEKRAAKGGERLTEVERNKIVELNKKIEDTQTAYEAQVETLQQKLVESEAQKLLEIEKARSAAEPKYEPGVLAIAERFATYMDTAADAARVRLKAKWEKSKRIGIVPEPLDPTMLSDAAIIGAAKLTRGVVDTAKWTKAMVADIGDWITPHLDKVLEESKKQYEGKRKKYFDELGTVEKKLDKPTIEKARVASDKIQAGAEKADITGKIGGKLATKKLGEVTPLIRKLVRAIVEENPKIKRDELVDEIHSILKSFDPNITRRESMDAISGYGDFKELPKDQISKTVRDLKGQLQLVAKLQDIESGQPPLKSGVERREMTDEQRRLTAKVEDAKRRYGIVVTDPATQLRSALDARKTYVRNQISDLQAQIDSREKFIKQKSPTPTDPQLEALKKQRDEVKAQFDEVFGKPEMTPEKQAEIAAKAIEKSIAEYERRIKEGDLFPGKKPSKTPNTPQLEALRSRRDALKEELKLLQDVARPKKTPEQIALQSFMARTRRQLADFQERLANQDFARRKSKEFDVSQYPEAMRLKAQNEATKAEFYKQLMEDRMRRWSFTQRAGDAVLESLNTVRNQMTSVDFSAVMRQGFWLSLAHPFKALSAGKQMFSATFSQVRASDIEQKIKHRQNFTSGLYKQAGLRIVELEESAKGFTRGEEAVRGRWANKLPWVKASNRGFLTYLNVLRADSFDALYRSLPTKTPEAANAIANAVNVFSGYGQYGKLGHAADVLSYALWSPRLLASRFQTVLGQPLWHGGNLTFKNTSMNQARMLIAAEYGKMLTGVAVIYGLGQAAGATVETDSSSSDFGKLRFDQTRLDPLAGVQQSIVFLDKWILEEKKTVKGRIEPLTGNIKWGKDDLLDETQKFFRSKLNPTLGQAIDLKLERDFIGRKVTYGSAAKEMAIPLAWGDIFSVMRENGVPAGLALQVLSIFGMGLQTYEGTARRPG